ncbi:hypothetical protein EL22_24150 [Halostagnicola sp. A56]|uniref:hypothetical protein n=1 Tax=Halostagnicola sp. A56 TaxID=1495067 RepID=UPI00049EFCC3|nr:hypothetical protein [Halostagnicola sp. A56]KDE59171.1 hypothetical protein EL22_24150 [Halostagnicola sp. A56]
MDDPETPPTGGADDLELTDAELEALHNLQLGIEHVHRAYGSLLAFHHQLGHAMDRMADAESRLRDADHDAWADELRDQHLPAGAVSDQWTFELVEEFSEVFLEELDRFEGEVRDELADGLDHVTERRQKRRVRDRAANGRSSGDDSDE